MRAAAAAATTDLADSREAALLRDRYRDAVDGTFRSGPDRSVLAGGFLDAFGGQSTTAGTAHPVLVEDLPCWLAADLEVPAYLGTQPGRQP